EAPAHAVAVARGRDSFTLLASVRLLGGLTRLAHARVLGELRRESGRGRPSGVPDRADRDDAAADVAAVAGGALLLPFLPGRPPVPRAWLDLHRPLRPIRGPDPPLLLPRPRLPDALRGRRRHARALRGATQLELDQACLRRRAGGLR